MNIIDKIKKIFKNNQIKMYYRDYDQYTNMTIYYEVTLNGNNVISTKMIEEVPDDVNINNANDSIVKDTFVDVKNKKELEREINEEYNFNILNYKDNHDKYINLIKILEEKCREYNVDYLNDEKIIYSKIFNTINEYSKNEASRKYVGDNFEKLYKPAMQYSFSKMKIYEKVNNEINDYTFNGKELFYEEQRLSEYCRLFSYYYKEFIYILEKEDLTNDELKTLSRYLEFLKCIPYITDIRTYLNDSIKKIEIAKGEYNKNKFNENHEFINEIDKLLSKVDIDKENIYIHATTSMTSAESIMDKGIYTYGKDLESFCIPYESVEDLLAYEYGNTSNMASNYIIVFRFPKDKYEVDEIKDEEANLAMRNINMRRSAILTKPSGKVNPDDILGVIDKKNMCVIYNQKFKTFKNKDISLR